MSVGRVRQAGLNMEAAVRASRRDKSASLSGGGCTDRPRFRLLETEREIFGPGKLVGGWEAFFLASSGRLLWPFYRTQVAVSEVFAGVPETTYWTSGMLQNQPTTALPLDGNYLYRRSQVQLAVGCWLSSLHAYGSDDSTRTQEAHCYSLQVTWRLATDKNDELPKKESDKRLTWWCRHHGAYS